MMVMTKVDTITLWPGSSRVAINDVPNAATAVLVMLLPVSTVGNNFSGRPAIRDIRSAPRTLFRNKTFILVCCKERNAASDPEKKADSTSITTMMPNQRYSTVSMFYDSISEPTLGSGASINCLKLCIFKLVIK